MGFTEAYSQIRTELAALFPNYNEIDNPYDLSKNADLSLKNAYGITINGAVNTTRTTSNRADITREFGIVLCQRTNATRNDTAARILTEKSLFEDLTEIIKKFENKIPNVTRSRYLSDSGVEFLEDSRFNYYILRAVFETEYSESLT